MNEKNGLFKKAENEAAFGKFGFYGDAGSGKTFTASKVAIGLVEFIKSKKPVFFLDSETGSDYVLPMFKKAGVDLQVAKSRAFQDLLEAIDLVEEEGSVLIVDSISHYWDELMESYKKKKNITRLFVQHWMELKPTWREFSTKFVASKLHIILCGRSGDVWSDVADDEGVKTLTKIGTKMRVEKETSYEPSLLVEMERFTSLIVPVQDGLTGLGLKRIGLMFLISRTLMIQVLRIFFLTFHFSISGVNIGHSTQSETPRICLRRETLVRNTIRNVNRH